MRRLTLALSLIFVACSTTPKAKPLPPIPPDENAWLEDIKAPRSLAWVKEQNAASQSALEKLPNFKRNEKEIREILLAKDRLPGIEEMGAHVYNFWQDAKAVRGIWRRTTLAEYRKTKPRWEIVLDFDALAKKEKENWVYKGMSCLPPEYVRCLARLSRDGKDAVVVREFDTQKKQFVKGGFAVPEAKSELAWVNENEIMVATDFGKGSLTDSGYPRIVKLWKRGTPLEQARTVLEGKTTDVSVGGYTQFSPRGNLTLVVRGIAYYNDEVYEVTPDLQLKKVLKPDNANYAAWINGQHILQLRTDWTVRGEVFKAGSVVALAPIENAQPKTIFVPNDRQSVSDINATKDSLIINYLDSVQSKVARAYLKSDQWVFEDLPFPEKGDISFQSVNAFSNDVILLFQNFLTPTSLLFARVGTDTAAGDVKTETLRSLPARFDASPFRVDQLWATSADGTKVPYYLLRKKDMPFDGTTPTLIYGYGGFEISQGPYYPSVTGKLWLEKGGAYVIANIRGGGEFGPKWHEAALKQNRQRAFDDFIAVAEDLIKTKVSSPDRLAISGGSNGGLLVGAVFVERPDLFRAVICKVPLLDMLHYNQWLAGASWMGEYGDPNDPALRPALLAYSPYQNVKPEVKYPEVFSTSTADDRVSPAHARKMVARMKAQGHPVVYFENVEGGHGTAANIQERIKMTTLEYTFLQDRLLK